MALTNLTEYQNNITSQSGEDGIVEEIINRIGSVNDFCIEFGAWDGKHLSNTWHLWHEKNWNAVLIEGDLTKAANLGRSVKDFTKVIPHCAYVAASGENTLDSILEKLEAPKEIDVLSIDIDGNDYYVFESLKCFLPRVVIIEYNPTIPSHIELVSPADSYMGSSALSIYKLAKSKNYSLAACTITNLILVKNTEFNKLGFDEPSLDSIMPKVHQTYVITAYDGATYLNQQPTYAKLHKCSLKNLLRRPRDIANRRKKLHGKGVKLLPITIYLDE